MRRAWARTGWKRGRLWKAIERWGWLAAAAPVSTRIPAGATMICDLQDEIQRLIFFFGVYEAPEAYVFTCLLKPGLTVIDRGANVGQYTLLASHRVGPGGSVHAFEPIPRNFEILRRHAARGHRITPLGPCATSDYIAQAGKLFATLDYDLRCHSYARRSRLAAKWESLRQPSSYPYSPELPWDLAGEISPKMDG